MSFFGAPVVVPFDTYITAVMISFLAKNFNKWKGFLPFHNKTTSNKMASFVPLNENQKKKHEIFISFRFGRAMTEARALQSELLDAGVNAFICDQEVGGNICELVVHKLNEAKLVVVLGTADYGVPGTVKFSTREEMQTFRENGKDVFLIKMCKLFEDIVTRHYFQNLAYSTWRIG